MTIPLTKLYGLLSEQIGKETAETLTTYIEEKIKDEVDIHSHSNASKQYLSDLKLVFKEDIGKVKEEISQLHVLIEKPAKKRFAG